MYKNNHILSRIRASQTLVWLLFALLFSGATNAAGNDLSASALASDNLALNSGESIELAIPANSRFLLVHNIGIDSIADCVTATSRLLPQQQAGAAEKAAMCLICTMPATARSSSTIPKTSS